MSTTLSHVSRTVARPLTRLAAALLVAGVCSGSLHAQQLLAPTATVGGYSQSFIQAQFSQWVLGIPADTNPVFDGPGADRSLGDQGSHFFLPGSFDGTPVVRNVTVRTDQTLFLNVANVTVWPDFNETEAELRAIGNHVIGIVNSMSVTVDGSAALLPAGTAALVDLRQSSPLFPLQVIPNNLGGWIPGVFPAISDGYLLAMAPLSQGNHQIRWTFNASPTGPFEGQFTFEQDITYNITAVPEASTWAMMSLGMLGIAGLTRRRRLTRCA
jgi:PEP-CTERM motif